MVMMTALIDKSTGKSRQQGIVLIITLVFLIALTALVSVLMSNTTVDLKIAVANQEKALAIQEVIGAVDEVIFKQVNQVDDVNHFTHEAALYPLYIDVTGDSLQAVVSLSGVTLNENIHPAINCPPIMQTSPSKLIQCNHLNITVSKHYGRSNNQRVVAHAGISQQLLSKCSTESCNEHGSEEKDNLQTMRTYLYIEEDF